MSPLASNTPIRDLKLARTSYSKLLNLECHTLGDLSRIEYSIIVDAIGHGEGKKILTALAGAGLRPCLREPTWSENEWMQYVEHLVARGLVNWKEIALAISGELNPPQVGTAIASSASFQRNYPPRKTMQAVIGWLYEQPGKCAVCGTRLFLEADHIKPRQEFIDEGRDPSDADTITNLQLLCKRCNVVKRPTHALGGLSFGPAQAVLMWIILAERPRTREQFYLACRAHGLTMANVRFDEAWAFAIWLAKEGKYEIDIPVSQ